ncbi:nucleotidyltransferase family protein [Luteibacter sp. UNCMF366Tsu5.1]|uniref:nucleotidyltransferase family protein n=1 Tax=Luteibacter sp. UNCMF366Tsu5.1 TaxID=1502758 RepID=UPI0009090C42|nr:nucleotidyltransferase family protein [Luteibacter sp. UNCMF366Tsu5.1]SFW38586.1 molybdenum cofactor cytidylyltransferase [Luteibacter sp. UNCMF366Tsu5.1]
MNAPHDAVILAAGGSRRLGRPKQLLTRGGETLVARTARHVLATSPMRTLVVVGAHADAVMAALDTCDVEFVFNPDWETGMASSLRIAAAMLADGQRPVLVTVVDQLALASRHLTALLDAHDGARDTVTAYGDAQGVPAVLTATTFQRATALQGDEGFRRLWRDAPPQHIRADELADDLDDRDDMHRAIEAGDLDRPA